VKELGHEELENWSITARDGEEPCPAQWEQWTAKIITEEEHNINFHHCENPNSQQKCPFIYTVHVCIDTHHSSKNLCSIIYINTIKEATTEIFSKGYLR
jgi:hypothetical protein